MPSSGRAEVLALGLGPSQRLAVKPSGRQAAGLEQSCPRKSFWQLDLLPRVVDLGLLENGRPIPEGRVGSIEIFDMAIGVLGVGVGAPPLRPAVRQLCNPSNFRATRHSL